MTRHSGESASGRLDDADDLTHNSESDNFEEFYRKHKPIVRRYAVAHLSDYDPDDVTQETMIRVWNAWHTFDRNQPVNAFLFTIARNTAQDMQRRCRPRADAEKHAPAPAPVEEPENRALFAETVRRVVNQLTAKQRAVFHLRIGYDLDRHETARRLNLKVTTADKHMYRAKKRFKRHFKRLSQTLVPVFAIAEALRRLSKHIAISKPVAISKPLTVSRNMASVPAAAGATTAILLTIAIGPGTLPFDRPAGEPLRTSHIANPAPPSGDAEPNPELSWAPPETRSPQTPGSDAAPIADGEPGSLGAAARVSPDTGPGEKQSHRITIPTPPGTITADGETSATASLIPAPCADAVADLHGGGEDVADQDADNQDGTLEVGAEG